MWTSERAILRDLSRAQGGRAGAAARPLAAADRPPPRARAAPETEEEYFEHCVGDGSALDKPDLGQIQLMLDMVRDLNVSEDGADDVAVISKLNPQCAEFKPRAAPRSPAPGNSSPDIRNKTRLRNVALQSIYQAMESQNLNMDTNNAEPCKVLRPQDIVPSVDVNTPSSNTVMLDSTSMFKKKKSKLCLNATTSKVNDNTISKHDTAYVPSSQAGHYYRRLLEKSQLAESLDRDIWTKAEIKMKEIDDRRRVEAAQKLAQAAAAPPASPPGAAGAERAEARAAAWRLVRREGPRAPPCAVCAAAGRARAAGRAPLPPCPDSPRD